MGIYLEADSKGVPLGQHEIPERLMADGACELTHPRYSPFLVCVFQPYAGENVQVAAFIFSRLQFRDKLFGVLAYGGARWFRAEATCRVQVYPQLIAAHLADFSGSCRCSYSLC